MNRHMLDLLRVATASTTFLLPSALPYRDIITEGFYSVSQLLSVLNHSFFDSAKHDSQPVLQTLSLIGTVVSHIEVFVEGATNAFGSATQKHLLVLIIEAIKAMCRLLTVLTSGSNFMLINWGKNDNGGPDVTIDLCHYAGHYHKIYVKLMRHCKSSSPLFQNILLPACMVGCDGQMHPQPPGSHRFGFLDNLRPLGERGNSSSRDSRNTARSNNTAEKDMDYNDDSNFGNHHDTGNRESHGQNRFNTIPGIETPQTLVNIKHRCQDSPCEVVLRNYSTMENTDTPSANTYRGRRSGFLLTTPVNSAVYGTSQKCDQNSNEKYHNNWLLSTPISVSRRTIDKYNDTTTTNDDGLSTTQRSRHGDRSNQNNQNNHNQNSIAAANVNSSSGHTSVSSTSSRTSTPDNNNSTSHHHSPVEGANTINTMDSRNGNSSNHIGPLQRSLDMNSIQAGQARGGEGSTQYNRNNKRMEESEDDVHAYDSVYGSSNYVKTIFTSPLSQNTVYNDSTIPHMDSPAARNPEIYDFPRKRKNTVARRTSMFAAGGGCIKNEIVHRHSLSRVVRGDDGEEEEEEVKEEETNEVGGEGGGGKDEEVEEVSVMYSSIYGNSFGSLPSSSHSSTNATNSVNYHSSMNNTSPYVHETNPSTGATIPHSADYYSFHGTNEAAALMPAAAAAAAAAATSASPSTTNVDATTTTAFATPTPGSTASSTSAIASGTGSNSLIAAHDSEPQPWHKNQSRNCGVITSSPDSSWAGIKAPAAESLYEFNDKSTTTTKAARKMNIGSGNPSKTTTTTTTTTTNSGDRANASNGTADRDVGAGASQSSGAVGTGTESNIFVMCPEDAMKLGEMLYILRPVIYALLVHQIEAYKEKKQTTSATAERSHLRSNDSTAGSTTSSAIANSITSLGSSSSSSSGGGGTRADFLSTALDAVSIDTLLPLCALAISFIIEWLSIELSSYALTKTRLQVRQTIMKQITTIAPSTPRSVRTTCSTSSSSAATTEDELSAVSDYYTQAAEKVTRKHAFDDELSRRRFALFLYLIRSPLFDRTTQPMLRLVANTLKSVPLIGALPDYALSVLNYLNKMHFYNSNS